MYIIAGAYTLDKYIDKNPSLANLYLKVMDTNLDSFGILLSSNKKYKSMFNKDKYYQQISKSREKIVKHPFDKRFNVLDSGGYQLSIGYLDSKYFIDYIEIYHKYLMENPDKYTEAFTLDLPISANLFKSFEEAYNINKISYNMSSSLPDNIRDKILLVSHFRTLNNFELYTKLLYNDGLLTNFNRFSIGGLVIGDKLGLPLHLYAIGMLQVLLGLKDNPNYQTIRFHVLGVSNTKHVLFLYILKYMVEDLYNIKLTMSYDSASIFKGFQKAREIEVLLENYGIYKLSLKAKHLHSMSPVGITNEKLFKDLIHQMLVDHNITDFNIYDIDIYQCDNCPFTDEIRMLASIYPVYEIKKIDRYLQNKAKYLIDLYKTNRYLFVHELDNTLVMLNPKGKTSYINDMRDTYITTLDNLPKYDSIDKLIDFMNSYSSVLDKEGYQTAPMWDI